MILILSRASRTGARNNLSRTGAREFFLVLIAPARERMNIILSRAGARLSEAKHNPLYERYPERLY
jgi:hypothetical protein